MIITACVLFAAFIMGLAGFALALPETSEGAEEDKLIGVFITTEYLDLFDMEGYLNNNLGKMAGGGEITMDGGGAEYQGRLYAVLKDRALTNEDTGEVVTTKEYAFEEAAGYCYFFSTMSNEDGTYRAAGSDEAISDGHTAISVTDEGESITLDGTIYVVPTAGHGTYFMNPVYQSADGRVYAMSGSGVSFVESGSAEGTACSQTLNATSTVTENGESKTYSISVKISFSVIYAPRRITLLQFGSDGDVLSRDEYLPGALPETISPEQGCSYIVLESHKTSPEAGEAVTRTLYQKNDETLESFYGREDGVCVKQFTALNWMA
jgi:hypothetical protein